MNLKKMVMITAIVVGVLVVAVIGFVTYRHISPLSWGMHKNINQPVFSDQAVNGYDPVAYLTEERAVKGSEDFTYAWNDATWYFYSRENLGLFTDNPEIYAPQFGGYCAFAVSKGFTADSDPDAFAIRDGKLYLFSEPKFRDEWLAGGQESVRKSQQNWE